MDYSSYCFGANRQFDLIATTYSLTRWVSYKIGVSYKIRVSYKIGMSNKIRPFIKCRQLIFVVIVRRRGGIRVTDLHAQRDLPIQYDIDPSQLRHVRAIFDARFPCLRFTVTEQAI